MSLIKSLSLSNKFLILFFINTFLISQVVAEDKPVDIWATNQATEKKSQKIIKKDENKNQSKINISKEKNTINEIRIVDTDTILKDQIKLTGLYDPEKNDLKLNMWEDTDGEEIKKVFSRINKLNLSNFSEQILIDTIFTYSYAPKKNLSEDEFLELKINWLIKNEKLDLIEEFLNTNLEFSGKSKLIKYLVDYYIASANISVGCEKINFINKEIKDNYLEKFRIYCLVLNKKNQQAQLNFDLLREEGRSDKFFTNKILFLLGLNEKPDNKISDKNLLYFYLSSITVENFKYEPNEKTKKDLWKFLNASNLISINELEDPEIIKKYEIAANEGTFDKNKIFEIYLSIPFNINQLINANNIYKSLEDYKARALIYQKILLSDNLEIKLDLLFLLKDLFKKADLSNIYTKNLSDILKSMEADDIPENYKEVVQKNIIQEKINQLGKIKYDDKTLHRSKVVKIFTEKNFNKDKTQKDFLNVYKKIKKNNKYFYSIKDIILLETLLAEGVDIPKDLNVSQLSKNLTVPNNIDLLVEKGEIGISS